MSVVLTSENLDRLALKGCQVSGCTHEGHNEHRLFPRCHPGRGCSVTYQYGSGVLTLRCEFCRALVCEVAVKGA